MIWALAFWPALAGLAIWAAGLRHLNGAVAAGVLAVTVILALLAGDSTGGSNGPARSSSAPNSSRSARPSR